MIRSLLSRLFQWLRSFNQELQPLEPIEILEQRELFYREFIRANDLCFDVGANMGNRIEPLLLIGARVVAIEPQKECYLSLKARFGNRIVIVPKGLGREEGEKDFYISDAATISSFSADWIESVKQDRFKEFTWNTPIKVTMTTLDQLIRQYGVPHFIKIDVEGYELEVLQGLTQPIDLISFEYTVPEQTEKVIECIQEIEKHHSGVECNYSIGESMEFAMKEWSSAEHMKELVHTEGFKSSLFGDVYVRSKTWKH